MNIHRSRILLVPVTALLAAVSACQDGTGPRAGPPAVMEIVDGNTQEAPVGTGLPEPVVVRVTDERGRPVRGQLVNFRVTAGGGSVFAGSALTNADGIARERWTLGTVAGVQQSLEARAVDPETGAALVFATFTATGTAAAPAQIAALNGDTTVSGAVGSLVVDTLGVVVRDQYGNPVPGTPVSWTVTTGGGSIAAVAANTDATGVARARWTLGAEAIAQHRAQAAAGGVGPVRFTALVATTITVFTAPPATAPAGSSAPVAVRVTGPGGDVPDLPVQWTAAGSGSASPAVSRTSGAGIAQTTWTFGPAAGAQTLTAAAGSLSRGVTTTVIGAGTRTLVAQVPGTVLETDGTRILWWQQLPSGSYEVKLRQGSTDVTVAGASNDVFSGKLFAGGALVSRQGANFVFTLVEHRNGTSQDLGPVQAWAAEGDWLAWAVNLNGPIVRRNLATGATDTILPATTGVRRISLDVAANGDVVYNLHYGGNGGGRSVLYRYRAGVHSAALFDDFSYGTLNPETDGTNIIFHVLPSAGGIRLRLVEGSGSRVLSTAPILAGSGPTTDGEVAGGWVAYVLVAGGISGPYTTPLRLITPAGADQAVQTPGLVHTLDALAPSGTLVYQGAEYGSSGWTRTRRYITPAGGAPSDVGPIANNSERVVYAGGKFYLLSGGTVYELAP